MALTRGSEGPPVRALQVLLNLTQNTRLPVDGVFSASVETFVRRAQADHGLGPSGVADAALFEALRRSVPPPEQDPFPW